MNKVYSSHNPSFYGVFSRDVTVAMLVFLDNGTAAVVVFLTNPPGSELHYHANVFFCFCGKTRSLITWVKTLYGLLNQKGTFHCIKNKLRVQPLSVGWVGWDFAWFCSESVSFELGWNGEKGWVASPGLFAWFFVKYRTSLRSPFHQVPVTFRTRNLIRKTATHLF